MKGITETEPQKMTRTMRPMETEPAETHPRVANSFGIAQTEVGGRTNFLDYTFLVHRQLIYEKKTKDFGSINCQSAFLQKKKQR